MPLRDDELLPPLRRAATAAAAAYTTWDALTGVTDRPPSSPSSPHGHGAASRTSLAAIRYSSYGAVRASSYGSLCDEVRRVKIVLWTSVLLLPGGVWCIIGARVQCALGAKFVF